MLLVGLVALPALSGFAAAQTKSLKLYYIHTGERAEITYKRNGQYLASGLKKINWHLRDWRRNEPTKMDPKLLDLVWEAYRQSGSKDYIHVISGYRAPASNNLLRSRGRGVAKNSQHTLGKALDFYLPDVKVSKLREIGLKMGVGGVGFYPKSGSPFVHLDTGSVRHWPRMSRQELVRVFPKGDTMHVPTDGKPLARYEQAVAAYERKRKSGKLIPEGPATAGGGNFFQRLAALNNTEDDEEDDSANATAPAPRAVRTQAAPTPAAAEPVAEPAEPDQPQVAALPPSRIPVPMIAPRGTLANQGASIALAAITPTPEPEPAPVAETEVALAREETPEEPIEEVTPTDENQEGIILASLSVPVPAQRPELTIRPAVDTAAQSVADSEIRTDTDDDRPRPDSILVEQADTPEPSSKLALVDSAPDPSPETRGTLVAALTPSEIEDLRSRVTSTLGASRPAAPTPVASIPAAGQPAAKQAISDIRVASLQPAAEQGVKSTVTVPVPQVSPSAIPSTGTATVTAVESDAAIETAPEMEPAESNPAESTIGEPEIRTFKGILLASLPVPRRNPQPVEQIAIAVATAGATPAGNVEKIQVASLETAKPASAKSATVQNTAAQAPTGLVGRTISLDRYSAPLDNTSTIGQFALATQTTIRDLSDVRAPAYGRNVIRQVPDTILVQSFAPQPFGPGSNTFSGRAVNAMNFAKRRIN